MKKKYFTVEELRESIRKRAREWAQKSREKVNRLQRESYRRKKWNIKFIK